MVRVAIAASWIVVTCLLGPFDTSEAEEPIAAFARGGYVLSVEGGCGDQFELFREGISDFRFVNAGVRVGLLPFGATGTGPFRGALEIGLEPFYQRFTDPATGFFAGLAAVGRYHVLSLGRLVPYLEAAGAGGGTDLNAREQDTDFVFLLFGGAGASYVLTDRTAVYAGYRFQHISNAGTDTPNRGINSHSGVLGVSFFFGK